MAELLPIVAMCPKCFKDFDITALRCPRCAKENVYHLGFKPAPEFQNREGSCAMCGKSINPEYLFCYECLQIVRKSKKSY